MDPQAYLYALACLTGLVAAGIVGSGWSMLTGQKPDHHILGKLDLMTPFKVVAVCSYAPLGVVRTGLWYLDYNLIVAVPILLLGLLWSFVQGVFILTAFFGFA